MKIKTWLLLSFLTVMLLPLIALYLLYILLGNFYEQKDVAETLAVARQFANIEDKLQSPELYRVQPSAKYASIRALTSPSIQIDLYRSDGVTLFSSVDQDDVAWMFPVNQERLFTDLYDIQESSRAFSVKKPVFSDGELLGIYKITIARQAWISGVYSRTGLIVSLLLIFVALLYAAIVLLLNRKLNRPLGLLTRRMQSFAQNAPSSPTDEHLRVKGEIGDVIDQFEEMKRQIVEGRDEVQRQQQANNYMVASLSHDLKTPLTSIRAYAEALSESPELQEKERKEYASVLFSKVEQMRQMIDDLAVYTSLQSMEHPPDLVPVDGDEFFEMLESGYGAICESKGIHLQTSAWVTGSCMVEPRQMTRLVDNLMNNALKYTGSDGRIWIHAQDANILLPNWVFPTQFSRLEQPIEPSIWILVQNEGPVIPGDILEKMYEPFYQGTASRTQKDRASSGLGLSIVQMIAKRHGGTFALYSSEGRGMLAVCQLPKIKRQVEQNEY